MIDFTEEREPGYYFSYSDPDLTVSDESDFIAKHIENLCKAYREKDIPCQKWKSVLERFRDIEDCEVPVAEDIQRMYKIKRGYPN